MRIQLKNNSEQVALVKAMASSDMTVANKAREDFAAAIGPVILQVLNLQATANLIYSDWPYNEDENPMFPLDQYYGANVDQVTVWQQSSSGGSGTSLLGNMQEMPLSTYDLSTAWSFLVKNLKRGSLPTMSLGLNRATQELLAKTERNSWLIIMKALAEARQQNGTSTNIISATTANVLQLDDFNRLITLSRRINSAFNQGTTNDSRGVTDLFMSPEMVEQLRSMAYQPMNTRGVPNSDESTAVALPDAVRQQIYNAAGVPSIYGKNIVEMLELGVGQRYNAIFGTFATAQSISFTAASDEVIVGVDTSRQAFIRPIAQNGEGVTLQAQVDDQFTKRSGKVGFFANQTSGAVCVDGRAVTAITV